MFIELFCNIKNIIMIKSYIIGGRVYYGKQQVKQKDFQN